MDLFLLAMILLVLNPHMTPFSCDSFSRYKLYLSSLPRSPFRRSRFLDRSRCRSCRHGSRAAGGRGGRCLKPRLGKLPNCSPNEVVLPFILTVCRKVEKLLRRLGSLCLFARHQTCRALLHPGLAHAGGEPTSRRMATSAGRQTMLAKFLGCC